MLVRTLSSQHIHSYAHMLFAVAWNIVNSPRKSFFSSVLIIPYITSVDAERKKILWRKFNFNRNYFEFKNIQPNRTVNTAESTKKWRRRTKLCIFCTTAHDDFMAFVSKSLYKKSAVKHKIGYRMESVRFFILFLSTAKWLTLSYNI